MLFDDCVKDHGQSAAARDPLTWKPRCKSFGVDFNGKIARYSECVPQPCKTVGLIWPDERRQAQAVFIVGCVERIEVAADSVVHDDRRVGVLGRAGHDAIAEEKRRARVAPLPTPAVVAVAIETQV